MPCRSALLTDAALGVDLELKEIDLLQLEHLKRKPEFIEVSALMTIHEFFVSIYHLMNLNLSAFLMINPRHTLSFLDGSVHIVESHAICTPSSEKYGENDTLCPKELANRALVDSRLHFDSGKLFCRMHEFDSVYNNNEETEFPREKIECGRSRSILKEIASICAEMS